MTHLSINEIIEGLEGGDDTFLKALKKWQPLLLRRVKSLAALTEEDEDDVLGGFMLRLVEAKVYYDLDLCRYCEKVFVIEKETENFSLISKPFNHKKKCVPFWMRNDRIAKIKKSSFDSFFYRIINQHFVDTINKLYTEKRNYKKSCVGTRMVTVRSGNVLCLEEKPVFEAMKVHAHVSFQDCARDKSDSNDFVSYADVIGEETLSPERAAILYVELDKVIKVFDNDQYRIFSEIMKSGTLHCSQLSKNAGMSLRKTKSHVEEICRLIDDADLF